MPWNIKMYNARELFYKNIFCINKFSNENQITYLNVPIIEKDNEVLFSISFIKNQIILLQFEFSFQCETYKGSIFQTLLISYGFCCSSVSDCLERKTCQVILYV